MPHIGLTFSDPRGFRTVESVRYKEVSRTERLMEANVLKATLTLVASLALTACTKSECANDSGCDTAVVEEEEESGPVSVNVDWDSGAILIVTIDGMGSGTFGMAETGVGTTGWYGEDCISPTSNHCHTVQDGTNSFVSVHEDTTGVAWDGQMDNNETLMRQETEENITWAVFNSSGDCVAVGGHDEEHYASAGCINL